MKNITGNDLIALTALAFFFGFICGYCINCAVDASKQLKILRGDD